MGYHNQVVCLEHQYLQAIQNELSKLRMCDNNKSGEETRIWEVGGGVLNTVTTVLHEILKKLKIKP